MVLKRAVILKIYYIPNGLTLLIHKKIHQIFRDVGGRLKNDPSKMLLTNFKERPMLRGHLVINMLCKTDGYKYITPVLSPLQC